MRAIGWALLAVSSVQDVTAPCLGIGLLCTAGSFLQYTRGSVSVTLVRVLGTSLRRQFDSAGSLFGGDLDDLIQTGIQGEPTIEKAAVLEEIRKTMERVQDDTRRQYQGYELEPLLQQFDGILMNSNNPGNDENFEDAVRALKCSLERGESRSRREKVDGPLTIESIRRLAIKAAETRSRKTVRLYLEKTRECPDILFAVGVTALKEKRLRVPQEALAKLESLAERKVFLQRNKETANLLGLLSHFCASDSRALREVAWSYLSEKRDSFKPTLLSCLHYAKGHYTDLLDWNTTDKLWSLEVELPSRMGK
ncbi:MAG TPA: hypothetical protein VN285_00370 [Candidatus Deferrimicrobium sp.]|nr:hypothetical protein [Candidatus Deferrimicrobium sp.]